MATKLEILLESIDPSRTLDQTSARVDQALNSFPMRKAYIDNLDEYESLLADFYRHMENAVLGLKPGAPNGKTFNLDRCGILLKKAFGRRWYPVVFEMVSSGKDGGLYRVLKTIADLMAEKYAQNEIFARIGFYWDALTIDEKFAAHDEYLAKYGHLLPEEWTAGYAARLRCEFVKVLEEHPAMIRRMRRIGR